MGRTGSDPIQAALDLHQSGDRDSIPVYATYHWTPQGLTEKFETGAVVYGFWERLFGCWISSGDERLDEILPSWPVFSDPLSGVNGSPVSVLARGKAISDIKVKPGHRADVYLAEYLNSVPVTVRRLAAPFGRAQWLVLDLCYQQRGFWRFLHKERTHGRTGVTGLLLRLFMDAGQTGREDRAAFAVRLMTSKRMDLFGELIGRTLSGAILPFLEKLPASLQEDHDKHLLEALKTGEPEIVSAAVSDIVNEVFSTFPEPLDRIDAAGLMAQGVPISRLHYVLSEGMRHLTDRQKKAALHGLSDIRAPHTLQWWFARWTDLGYKSRRFPAPPVAATGPLLPISSRYGLEAEQTGMNNGAATYLSEILAGELYLYHWEGPEPATICLAATSAGDWLFHDAFGIGQAPLGRDTLTAIVDCLKPDRTSP
ncbi:MAG: hypothetical protein JJ902_19095 [Roseibium sp.]|nr:hypothetical protein [Roseibium sp.]